MVATLALYNPVSHHPFVNFDDDRYVTDNVHVRAGLHWQTVRWAFTTYDEANWHPLTWLSHALDCQLFGLTPAGPHYVNLLLHALNAFLLFWLLWRATGSTGPSLMVAGLFALHPINVESVAWVAERKTVLSMLFFLLALWAYGWYASKPGVGRYLTVTAAFACGLMSKPMVITLPFVLLLWDYWPLERMRVGDSANVQEEGEATRSFSRLAREKTPLLLMSAISAVVTTKAQEAGNAVRSIEQFPIHVRFENAVISYVRYIGKAFWPAHLSPMYPLNVGSLKSWQVAVAVLFLMTVTVAVCAARQRRFLLVGWLWFLGTLVPMIGLVQVGSQAMADRYAYLSFLGLFIMVCWTAEEVATSWRRSAIALAAIGALCLLALAMVTFRQIGYWADNLTLWTHAVQVTSGSFIAEDSLGGALLEQGRFEDAIPHFRAAAAINPSDPFSRLNMGAYSQEHEQLKDAIDQYSQVVMMTPDPRLRATAFSDMGYAYRELGDSKGARENFQAAVILRPRTLRAWLGLGLVAHKGGDYAEAIDAYSHALAIQPWDLGYFLLSRALEQSGRREESKAALQQAQRLSENPAQLPQLADSILAR